MGRSLSTPSYGSMFHGGEVAVAWLVANAVALFGIAVLGVTALVLDIVLLVKLSTLRNAGVPTVSTRPLLIAVVTGTALVTTPVGLMLMLVPSVVLGPGSATNTVLLALLVLLFLAPLAGRAAEGVLAARLPALLASQRSGPPVAAGPAHW